MCLSRRALAVLLWTTILSWDLNASCGCGATDRPCEQATLAVPIEERSELTFRVAGAEPAAASPLLAYAMAGLLALLVLRRLTRANPLLSLRLVQTPREEPAPFLHGLRTRLRASAECLAAAPENFLRLRAAPPNSRA
jgi:hypothetical protein